jgi:hypothetical protein
MDYRRCQTATASPAVGYQTDGLDNQVRNRFRLDWSRALAAKAAGSLVLSQARPAVWQIKMETNSTH